MSSGNRVGVLGCMVVVVLLVRRGRALLKRGRVSVAPLHRVRLELGVLKVVGLGLVGSMRGILRWWGKLWLLGELSMLWVVEELRGKLWVGIDAWVKTLLLRG